MTNEIKKSEFPVFTSRPASPTSGFAAILIVCAQPITNRRYSRLPVGATGGFPGQNENRCGLCDFLFGHSSVVLRHFFFPPFINGVNSSMGTGNVVVLCSLEISRIV